MYHNFGLAGEYKGRFSFDSRATRNFWGQAGNSGVRIVLSNEANGISKILGKQDAL
jgi:hypothetical protein